MEGKTYITASCIISGNAVYKNGRILFEDIQDSLQDFLVKIYKYFGINYPKFYKMDNLSKLGWLSLEVLLKDSFNPGLYKPEEIGLVMANANSSLDTDIRYFESTKTIPSPALFVYTLPNIMMGEMCIRHNFKGENIFFIFEKFDAGFIQQYVNNLINNNTLQACICGWVELLEDQYKSVLFLVEEKQGSVMPAAEPFTTENIIKIYQTDNG